jgi:hypothetical protein
MFFLIAKAARLRCRVIAKARHLVHDLCCRMIFVVALSPPLRGLMNQPSSLSLCRPDVNTDVMGEIINLPGCTPKLDDVIILAKNHMCDRSLSQEPFQVAKADAPVDLRGPRSALDTKAVNRLHYRLRAAKRPTGLMDGCAGPLACWGSLNPKHPVGPPQQIQKNTASRCTSDAKSDPFICKGWGYI